MKRYNREPGSGSVRAAYRGAALFLMSAWLPWTAAAQQANQGAYDIIKNNVSASQFIDGPVRDADLEQILSAGLSAPSASNRQPWKFVVVKTPALVVQTLTTQKAPSGNLTIVVYAKGDSKTNTAEILDCALAVENLFLAAQALGYGSRIYTGSVAGINAKLKNELGIPADSSAVAVVRVGKIASRTDALSSASKRKALTEIVTYK